MKESKQQTVIRAFFFGSRNSGKTSLLVRESKNTFNQPLYPGIDLFTKTYFINDELIKGQLWDAPTFERNFLEKSSIILPSPIKKSKLYGVCFDLNKMESFQIAHCWIKRLRQFNQTAEIFFIGCKSDLEHQIPIQKIDSAQYFQVSSKNNKGVNETFVKIIQRGLRLQQNNQTIVITKTSQQKQCNLCKT